MSKKSKYAVAAPKAKKAPVVESPEVEQVEVTIPVEAKAAVDAGVKEEAAKKPAKETQEERDERISARTIKLMMQEAIPAMLAGIASVNTDKDAAILAKAGKKIARRVICNVCKQGADGEPPCKGIHTQMIVYPQRYPQFGVWFQGCFVNGIRYLSDNRNDYITIPAECVGQFTKIIHDFEENEYVTRMGRYAEHNSGDVKEGGGGMVNPPQQAWR